MSQKRQVGTTRYLPVKALPAEYFGRRVDCPDGKAVLGYADINNPVGCERPFYALIFCMVKNWPDGHRERYSFIDGDADTAWGSTEANRILTDPRVEHLLKMSGSIDPGSGAEIVEMRYAILYSAPQNSKFLATAERILRSPKRYQFELAFADCDGYSCRMIFSRRPKRGGTEPEQFAAAISRLLPKINNATEIAQLHTVLCGQPNVSFHKLDDLESAYMEIAVSDGHGNLKNWCFGRRFDAPNLLGQRLVSARMIASGEK